MTDTKNDSTLESSIPSAPLESILCTEELQRLWAVPNDGPGATFSFAIPFIREGLADVTRDKAADASMGAA